MRIATCLALLIPFALGACQQEAAEAPDSQAVATSPAAAETAHAEEEILIHPELWPQQDPVMVRDPEDEQRIADLLARMTLEEKVGQVIQADIASVTPDEVREYNLGSVLNGGGSAPAAGRDPEAWLALADEFWDASTDTSDGGVGIPAIWGTDAVHGHSNVRRATVFPHNIGLGAANDLDLMYDIGRVTALEMLATGMDWTFAPTIAVVRNDRWGRTYESYSEDPAIVAAFAPRIIEGIQGRLGTDEFLGEGRMIATAKHYAGDGGTVDGKDQGDTVVSEAEFRDVQAAGYPPAVRAGVQSVMASFNSYHGHKMHGFAPMLSDVLVGRFGFDGFTVGDWNGHGQVAGCTNTSCAQSFNAGLDMFMAPDSWKGLYESMLAQVQSGEITMERLDEAVSRILRVKLRMGVFEAGPPSSRPGAGDFDLLGSPEHRAVARRAVRQSLVLLKNEGVLPIAPQSTVLVAGDGADHIGKQAGGWTLSWQGTGLENGDFPNGVSVYGGIAEAVSAAGGTAVLSEDGSFTDKPDVAVVVFGEDPYAEFQGDRPNVDYPEDDGIELLQSFEAQGIPTVAVFISGRPLWVNPEINASDAFVAAWLPGSEGGNGIADLLIAAVDGTPRHDFTGRLSFSWPKRADQAELNVGDVNYDPLFAYGYGLDYATGGSVGELSEASGIAAGDGDVGVFLAYGDPAGPWSLILRDAEGDTRINDSRGVSPAGALSVAPFDREVQEDAIELAWSGPATLVLEGRPVDFTREANGDMAIELTYRVVEAPASASIAVGNGAGSQGVLDAGAAWADQADEDWQTALLKLSCFEAEGAAMDAVSEALLVASDAPFRLQLQSARVVANPGNAGCGL